MYQTLIEKAKEGFKDISFSQDLKNDAIRHIKIWLKNSMFKIYSPHIINLINTANWEILFDSFYKKISFGTGGKRGLIGVGPNRINICTVKASAQGFSQYLKKKFGNYVLLNRGIILAYDARENIMNGFLSANFNIKKTISSLQLAESAAKVYTSNGIKVHIFNSVRSTPELSFSIIHLGAAGGCMFTASHNSPKYNGEKFYDCNGNQFIPPHDEHLSSAMDNVENTVYEKDIKNKTNNKIIKRLDSKIDEAYYEKVKSVTLNSDRKIKILYSPLHGTGITSLYPILSQLGFNIYLDKKTSNLSGYFENIPFNIPNPELRQSFDNLIDKANVYNVDLIMNTDSDADRLGVMVRVKNNNKWEFLNGNQIGIILAEYILTNIDSKKYINDRPIIIKTFVTSSLINEIANQNNANCISNLLTGFKYICNEVNNLYKKGLENTFVLGIEESNGYLVGPYCREKDAAGAAVLIAELAAILKKNNLTLVDYINNIYFKYGYCHNYSTKIKFSGANGVKQINQIMNYFRTKKIAKIGTFDIKKKIDNWKGFPQPHLSTTDTNSRNMITFMIKTFDTMRLNKLTIRPSGTESKLKIYIEIFGLPFPFYGLNKIKNKADNIRKKIETYFMIECSKNID